MTRAEHIHAVYQRGDHAFNALWAWAIEPKTRRERFMRFRALQKWAAWKRDNNRDGDTWHTWNQRRLAYRHRKLRIWRKLHQPAPPPPGVAWPASMHITELFNNDNSLHNHVHVASPDRNALIALGNIAVAHYGGAGMVREFPPFDPVECVHVSSSWHYRDSSSPFTIRACANRGDGLAMDLGFVLRQEFGDEVKARYGADSCDF